MHSVNAPQWPMFRIATLLFGVWLISMQCVCSAQSNEAWERVPLPPHIVPTDLGMVDDMTGLMITTSLNLDTLLPARYTNTSLLWRTDDGGSTWTDLMGTDSLPRLSHLMVLDEVTPMDSVFVIRPSANFSLNDTLFKVTIPIGAALPYLEFKEVLNQRTVNVVVDKPNALIHSNFRLRLMSGDSLMNLDITGLNAGLSDGVIIVGKFAESFTQGDTIWTSTISEPNNFKPLHSAPALYGINQTTGAILSHYNDTFLIQPTYPTALCYSVDSGRTWISEPNLRTSGSASTFRSSRYYATVGDLDTFKVSSDFGRSWAKQVALPQLGHRESYTKLIIVSDQLGFILGTLHGTLLRTTSTDLLSSTESPVGKGLNPGLRIYPNPSGGWMRYELSKGIAVQRARILGAQGQTLQELPPDEEGLNLDGLATGTYYLHLETNFGTVTRALYRH